MEVRFNAASRLGRAQTVPQLKSTQPNLSAVSFDQAADAFVRRAHKPTAATMVAERAMAARPSLFDYRGAAFSARAAKAFMQMPLL